MSDISANKNKEFWMPPHTRVCVTATGAVLLDLKRNRYFGLGYREARSLSTLASNWSAASTSGGRVLEPMEPGDAARLATALVKAGFLTAEAPEPGPQFVSLASETPLTSVGHELAAAAHLHLHHIIAFLRACVWAKRAVDSRLLYSIVGEVAAAKAAAAPTFDIERTVELVSVFRRLRPYAFAAKDQCLFHALALLRFLFHYDVFPTWVIAVRPTPWAAHSWLQLGNFVLDCNPEEICDYTPILAV
ncbi:MAG TPA: lasso peptide biosynthesis B2 protein [Steroidobacteraceae bacterium]|nr:lasso peptide biosynthesis B2 protein [Steroidobacteraceae bacterium]